MLIAERIKDTSTLLHWFEACETTGQAVEQMPKSMMTILLLAFTSGVTANGCCRSRSRLMQD